MLNLLFGWRQVIRAQLLNKSFLYYIIRIPFWGALSIFGPIFIMGVDVTLNEVLMQTQRFLSKCKFGSKQRQCSNSVALFKDRGGCCGSIHNCWALFGKMIWCLLLLSQDWKSALIYKNGKSCCLYTAIERENVGGFKIFLNEFFTSTGLCCNGQ